MPDPFEQNAAGLTSPLSVVFAVTPDDGNDLAVATRGVMVGTSGDLEVTLVGMATGTSVVLKGLAAGVFHPVRCARILAGGTTAGDIVGGY